MSNQVDSCQNVTEDTELQRKLKEIDENMELLKKILIFGTLPDAWMYPVYQYLYSGKQQVNRLLIKSESH